MSILVLDTETTGLSAEEDRVCEIAVVEVDPRQRTMGQFAQSLVNPGRGIPHQASAVHHLTDSHVEGAPGLEEVLDRLVPAGVEAYCAHNAQFDRGFLIGLPDRPWVCTWKCAKAVWSEAPSYSNQVLRYWLKLDVPLLTGRGAYPHSALYDALTTAQILLKLLEEKSVEELVEISGRPVLLKKMTFGKHKGTLFSEVPKDYRAWLRRQPDLDDDLKYTLDYHA
ncbi:MAG: DUF3820 family protein [Patescibacteria group bacterium]|nr:DUF3820 family protein [Patescibacteria group bacterium]